MTLNEKERFESQPLPEAPETTVDYVLRQARRLVIFVVGMTVVLLGLIMMVAPGPGIAGVLAGLGILAVEFVWARKWLKYVKETFTTASEGLRRTRLSRWPHFLISYLFKGEPNLPEPEKQDAPKEAEEKKGSTPAPRVASEDG